MGRLQSGDVLVAVLVLMLTPASVALAAADPTVPVAHYDARCNNYPANLDDEYVVQEHDRKKYHDGLADK